MNTAIMLVSKITKLEWAHEAQRSIIHQIKQIMELSPTHRTLGLTMYSSLVQEMSINVNDQKIMPIGKQLRVMTRFKNELLDILNIALSTLKGCITQQQQQQNFNEQEAALRLLRSVLSFNFKPFELSDDDDFTLYAPDTWAPVFESGDLQETLVESYFVASAPPCSTLSLECLCLVTAVKTSIFHGDWRAYFVGRCLNGTGRILESGRGLECQENHHMFARLLLSIKANFRIRELVSAPIWQTWITHVYTFTVQSLKNWMFSPNSVHFLMHFWFKLSLCYDSSLNKVVGTAIEGGGGGGGNSGSNGNAFMMSDETPFSAPASPASLSFFRKSPSKVRALRKSFLRQFQQPQTPMKGPGTFADSGNNNGGCCSNNDDCDVEGGNTSSNNTNNVQVVEDQTFITKFAPRIAEEFISGRVASVQVALTVGLDEDYLGSEEAMSEQLGDIPYIARCEYRTTGLFVVNAFEKVIGAFQGGGARLAPGSFQSNLLLGQCAWFVYFIGAFLSVRIERPTREENDILDEIDGELASRVLFLMQLTEARVPATPEAIRTDPSTMETALEVAYSYFLFHLRRSYIRDTPYTATTAVTTSSSSLSSPTATPLSGQQQQPPQSKFFGALEKNLGFKSVMDVFNAMFLKMANNLKWYRGNDTVTEKTLSAFHELATGYSTQRTVSQLPIVAQFLTNHSSLFPIDDDDNGGSNSAKSSLSGGDTTTGAVVSRRCKHCVALYRTLGRLVFADESGPERFDAFMAPIGEALGTIGAQPSREAALAQPRLKSAALLCISQLQGLFESATSRRAYSTFFRWLSPKYLPVLAGLGRLYGGSDPAFYYRLMKLVCELVWNRSCRISFDASSPESGLLLFKEVCMPTLTEFGSQLQPLLLQQQQQQQTSHNGSTGDTYHDLYRYVTVCVQTMLNAILGDFIDFGAFVYYKDACLGDALGVVLRMLLTVPPDDMVGYEKLFLPAASLLSVVAAQFPAALFQLEETAFGCLLRLLVSGIVAATNPQLISCCCIVIDKLFSAYNDKKKKLASVVFNNGGELPAQHRSDRAAELAASTAGFEHNLATFPDFIESVIRTLFYLSYSAKEKYVYVAAKAIYALTLFAPHKFRDAEERIVRSQPQAGQERLMGFFASLEKKISSDSECIFAATLKEKFCNLFSNFIDVTCNLIDLNTF